MNKDEARAILISELAKYRERSYDQLCAIVDAAKHRCQVTGVSGTQYQIEIYAYWDAKPRCDVRVIGCIDDGGWRAFVPMSDSFIKAPDGSFVGEGGS
jgi:hypothetical protein